MMMMMVMMVVMTMMLNQSTKAIPSRCNVRELTARQTGRWVEERGDPAVGSTRCYITGK